MPSKTTVLDTKRSDLDEEQDDVDELAGIRNKIEAMAPNSEERKMAVREWKRLKRIPAGSVENGVIRSYVGHAHTLTQRLVTKHCSLNG